MKTLASKNCIPCHGGIPALSAEQMKPLFAQLENWEIVNNHHLTKTLILPDFVTALKRVNEIGALAEKEGHHPDLYLAWGKVRIEIWTHAVNGLTESDFVLAAKIDQLK